MAKIEQNQVKQGWSYFILVLLVSIMIALAVSGCATVSGLGSDLQDMGTPRCTEHQH